MDEEALPAASFWLPASNLSKRIASSQ